MSTSVSPISHNTNSNGKKPADVNIKQTTTIGDYIIGAKLGEGTFSKVCQGTHRTTNEKVAIKIMSKSQIKEPSDKVRIEKEINIQKRLHHNSIIQQYCVIETKSMIYIITEYCSGGELFDYIVSKRKWYEIEACRIFQQLISGLEYWHKQRIVHRDWKPENLWFDSKHELKIADFGLSNDYTGKLNTPCGSPCYAAPEMVTGNKYKGSQVDIWSSGIVLYTMVCGYWPFEDDDQNVLFRKIAKGIFSLPNSWSPACKDLIRKILITDPSKRMTFEQIKHHPWFVSVNNIKGESIYSSSPGLFITSDVIPIDEDIVYELKTKYDFEWRSTISDVIRNKHNNWTTTYYWLLRRKIRNGVPSVSDISSRSEAFMNYLKLNISKQGYWNNDIERVISYYEGKVERKFNGRNTTDSGCKVTEGIENGYERACDHEIRNDNGSDMSEMFNTITNLTFTEGNVINKDEKKNGAENGNNGDEVLKQSKAFAIESPVENKKKVKDNNNTNHMKAPGPSTIPNVKIITTMSEKNNNNNKIDKNNKEDHSQSDSDIDYTPIKTEWDPQRKKTTSSMQKAFNANEYVLQRKHNKSVDWAEIKKGAFLNTINNPIKKQHITEYQVRYTKEDSTPHDNKVPLASSNNAKKGTEYLKAFIRGDRKQTAAKTLQKQMLPSCNHNQIKKFINKLTPSHMNNDIFTTEVNNNFNYPKANGLDVNTVNPILSTEPSAQWKNYCQLSQNKAQLIGGNNIKNNLIFRFHVHNKWKEKKRPVSINSTVISTDNPIKQAQNKGDLLWYQNSKRSSSSYNNNNETSDKPRVQNKVKHLSQEITHCSPWENKPNGKNKFSFFNSWRSNYPSNSCVSKFTQIQGWTMKPTNTRLKTEINANARLRQFDRKCRWISNCDKMKHYSQEPTNDKRISNAIELTCPKNNGNSFILESEANMKENLNINALEFNDTKVAAHNNNNNNCSNIYRNYQQFKTKGCNYNHQNNINLKLDKFINKERKSDDINNYGDTIKYLQQEHKEKQTQTRVPVQAPVQTQAQAQTHAQAQTPVETQEHINREMCFNHNNLNHNNNNWTTFINTTKSTIPKNSYKQNILWKEREIINSINKQYLNICCKRTVDSIRSTVTSIIGQQINWVKALNNTKIEYECKFTEKSKNYIFMWTISKLPEVQGYVIITPTWLKGNMSEFKEIFDRIKRKLI